jgi:hypothetical protein
MNLLNDLDIPTGQREYKAYATLQAQLAMHGHVLIKTDPTVNGQAPYCTVQSNRVQPHDDLGAVRDYLAALRGACVP